MKNTYLQPHTADSGPVLVCGSERIEFTEREAMYWAFQLMHWLYWKDALTNRSLGKTPNNLQYTNHSPGHH